MFVHVAVLSSVTATSFALVLASIGTFVGTLGGIGKAAKWVITRADRKKREALEAEREKQLGGNPEVRRLSDWIDRLEKRNASLEEQLETRDEDMDSLRFKLHDAIEGNDKLIGEVRTFKLKNEELELKCAKLERESKRKQ